MILISRLPTVAENPVHPMELTLINADETYTHLALTGKMDVMGVNDIEASFLQAVVTPGRNAIVDLSGVTFLGSMGIRVFLSAAKSLAREQKKLILLHPQPLVNDVLNASGIGVILIIAHDTDSALAQAQV